ncbi:hypothetical protein PR048_001714 [Dryococelus australis]|uniref:Uncharacterized protein n=1 Tax=Dryococelus australis TaxID=614101 RepID=A0ABQ9II47_9NEOP|nr:hypothetical protein PR048_001714 [Dryococelus australis]
MIKSSISNLQDFSIVKVHATNPHSTNSNVKLMTKSECWLARHAISAARPGSAFESSVNIRSWQLLGRLRITRDPGGHQDQPAAGLDPGYHVWCRCLVWRLLAASVISSNEFLVALVEKVLAVEELVYSLSRVRFPDFDRLEGEQDMNWGKKDAKAQRYIVTMIDKGNIQFIMSCDSAKGIFDKLCSIYERDSSRNKSSLLQNFFNYKMDKVPSGLFDLQNLSMKLKSVGHTVDNERMMAERLNRMLMEKTRALLFDSGLEKELWEEALHTATYLLNRSPSATVDTTPAELWYGKRQDLSNLKLFGSLAYGKKIEARKTRQEM